MRAEWEKKNNNDSEREKLVTKKQIKFLVVRESQQNLVLLSFTTNDGDGGDGEDRKR